MRGLLKQAPLPSEAIVYTRIPMMITKHCPVKLLNQQEFLSIMFKYTIWTTWIGKNKILPLLRTGNCLTEIFNSQHLILIEFINELKKMGVQSFPLRIH